MNRSRSRASVRRLVAIPALAALVGGTVMSAPTPALAMAPEPAPIPKRWQLEIEPSPLRLTTVNVPGEGWRPFFYMTIKVTNNSPGDLLFAPAIELSTDDMIVLRSGRDVPASATTDLIERMQNPLLRDQIAVVGTLLRGEENAEEFLVAWPMPADFQSEIAVYCAGFSGETATIEVPSDAAIMAMAKGDKAPAVKEKRVLRKTYMLRYRLPGVLNPGQGLELQPFEKRWIMR
jgi:hypothetical protein